MGEAVNQTYPLIQLELQQSDLAVDALPEAGLTLGMHPGPLHRGPWRRIVSNVVKSVARSGVCIFAHFFKREAKVVANWSVENGLDTQIYCNPYYRRYPIVLPVCLHTPCAPWIGIPFLQYIVLCKHINRNVPGTGD